jgi:hypothetical protein
MPTIANIHRGSSSRPSDAPEPDSAASPPFSLMAQIRVTVRRSELTRALAEGVDPSAHPDLALRARQLTSTRTRNTLARTLRRICGEAHTRPMTRSQIVIIEREAVIDAEELIASLIRRLLDPRPVRAEGVAIAERMITNAGRSPLYNAGDPGALRRLVLAAETAMEPAADRSHEFRFPALRDR